MEVFGRNRGALVDRHLEGPSGIGPRSRRDHGDIGAVHRETAGLGHECVIVDHALRRRDPARKIGMGEVDAVVRDRDGRVLAEIAALVGRIRGDALQSPMFPVFRGPVVLAVRRGGRAQIDWPKFESARVRRGRLVRARRGRLARARRGRLVRVRRGRLARARRGRLARVRRGRLVRVRRGRLVRVRRGRLVRVRRGRLARVRCGGFARVRCGGSRLHRRPPGARGKPAMGPHGTPSADWAGVPANRDMDRFALSLFHVKPAHRHPLLRHHVPDVSRAVSLPPASRLSNRFRAWSRLRFLGA